MTWDPSRFTVAMRTAAAAGLMGWLSLWSWHGFVEQAPRFLWPALFAGVLIALTGSLARSIRVPWYATLVALVVVVLVWLHHHAGVGGRLDGWLPTPASTGNLVNRIHAGATVVNRYSAPVAADHPAAIIYLLAAGILILLSVDLIACGLRQPPWSGLPVIITATVPISVLDGGLPWPVFITTALAFVMLMAVAETDRMLSWGQPVTGHRPRAGQTEKVFGRASARGRALQIGAVTTAAALVVPIFIPIAHGLLDRAKNHGSTGVSEHVTLVNPLVNLRRDLVAQDHVPLLLAQTNSPDPTYLRTTVLDEFDGTNWTPSSRNLPQTNVAAGVLPDPAGIDASTPGVISTWDLQITPGFTTTWLPVPYATRTISIDRGDWRYAVNTLDIADTDTVVPVAVEYHLTAFAPTIDPAALDAASLAPETIQGPMTKLPTGVPTEVRSIARHVTASGSTPYAKAVLLQDWFRSKGGFRYSLGQAPGNGMAQLTRFITTDKVGYCEQFAAAMAIMARALGIPARVDVGFLAPSVRRASGTYLYTSDDLHAWPEIYFRGSGWVRFEPTPSVRTGPAPSWTRGVTGQPSPVLPTTVPSTVKPRPIRTNTPQASPPAQGGSATGYRWLISVALVVLLLLAAALPRLVRNVQQRRRLRVRPDSRAEVDDLWNELRATAIDLGIIWPGGRSVREIAQVLLRQARAGREDELALEGLVDVVERARYAGTFALDETTRAAMRSALRRWSVLLTTVPAAGSARRARWLPRSVFETRRAVAVEVDARSSSLTEVS
jgi:transglutaminase-like putative cysteine protease